MKARSTRGRTSEARRRASGSRAEAVAESATPGRRRPPASAKLAEYHRKRDPARTTEPFDTGGGDGFFVVQKHAARRLHYDFRLAMGGVLVSWAVPKGPSYNPRERRLAVHVEDHPLSYRDFEGTIPTGEYGAGSVIVWDTGPFRLREGSIERGSLKVDLFGRKLVGGWALVRMKDADNQWLLIKEKDEHADPRRDVTAEEPESVQSGLGVEEIGRRKGTRQWNSSVLRTLESLPPGTARRGAMPRNPTFMRARLQKEVPVGEGWLYEIKLDGVRALAMREGGDVRLVTRNGKEVAFRYPEITEALASLPGGDFVMDGEIVAFDREGRSRFELLQGRIHLGGEDRISSAAESVPLHYYAFDLLYAEGLRLEDVPLVERKRVLRTWLEKAPARVRFSDHVEGRGKEFLRLACERGLEGVIAKRAESSYRGARSGEWVKVKCLNTQEFVVGGFTPPRGGRTHLGSLLLGVYDDGNLVYAGKVGTGFTDALLADTYRQLRKLERASSPFVDPPRERGVRWVEPRLVAEVRFTEWTSDGKLRHPAFAGLRDDKDPRSVVRELPRDGGREGRVEDAGKTRGAVKPRSPAPKRGATSRARERDRATARTAALEVAVTNPDKLFYPEAGVTKGEVVEYYRELAPVLLPWLEERPLTLVRYPEGIRGGSFFQKDQPDWLPEWIPTVKVTSQDGKKVDYLVCNDEPTLVYVANLGTIDLHPMAARVSNLDKPDYVVWDLDPPEGEYAKAARLAPSVREILDEAGLRPFLKTSGGKGLHLYVPLVAEHDHDTVRDFAEAIARLVVQANPRATTLERTKARRRGKVYVDFMQNGRGKTVVAPYSLRAREPATVSMPLTWDELEAGAQPGAFTIRTVPGILRDRGDAWRGFWKRPASLQQALTRLTSR